MAVCTSSGEKTDIPPQWLAYDGDIVRNALRHIQPDLESRLPHHTLPSLLSSRDVITDAEVQIVSGSSNSVSKNRSLLNILKGKDKKVILQFFAMLKSHPKLTGYSELVEAFDSNMRSMQLKKGTNTKIRQSNPVMQKLLDDYQTRLEKIDSILHFTSSERVHGYSSVELNSRGTPNVEKTSECSASAMDSLLLEHNLLTQLCAYIREQMRWQENTYTSDSVGAHEDESKTKDSAQSKRGSKTEGLPIHRSCNNVQEMQWYWGSIGKDETKELLMFYPHGSFLVRDSTSMPGSYALAIRKEEGVETYLISDQNGLCGFEGCAMATFQLPTVVDLVRFCCIYSICICGPLKKGVAKEEHHDHKERCLQRKVDSLESENALLKEQLAAYKEQLAACKEQLAACKGQTIAKVKMLLASGEDSE